MWDTVVRCAEVQALLDDPVATPGLVLVDCRADLKDHSAGARAYAEGHIPGAVFAALEGDLSGPPVTDRGRHPLPTPAALAALFGRLGIDAGRQVVAYDDLGGAFAARLWWMLRYLGHHAVAVLEGGWPAWLAAGGPVETHPIHPVARPPVAQFSGTPATGRLATLAEVLAAPLLVDARDPARYRGDEEPLDPRAGHIPGARNHFFRRNLDEEGLFLPPERLREAFRESLGGGEITEDTIFYCGSGVTACQNILAAVRAGLPEPRLYAGSWSEWSRTPDLPVATGPTPEGRIGCPPSPYDSGGRDDP
jgi:thiosulfate/3-mercaptopyruvate sulfurtransferase